MSKTNKFGLKKEDMEYMHQVFKQFPEINKVLVYGSRARGDFKNGSDVDLALYGKNINFDIVSAVHLKLEQESAMPFLFDVHHYESLTNSKLKKEIDQFGVLIYGD
ncbi:MAG: nucleotidyltransferase domain-containing protein [Candidatus Caenarcaniphilales bacterium]|nr:nucleotidyltransferase domain-containing protein [Candidatus Caenarcaniphilales bacterium]